jgi:hypothetical protein
MTQRTVEDRLREEYLLLSSEIRRVLHQLRTDVAYLLLPLTLDLKYHEHIHVEAGRRNATAPLMRYVDAKKQGSSAKTPRRNIALLTFQILRRFES